MLYRSYLNPDEQTRANRFHFERHKRRFTIARGTLRLILSQYLQCQACDVQFDYDKHGKPKLIHTNPITFNLSHTGEYGCLAVGYQQAVGIDIEQFSDRDYHGIGRHVFSEQERTQLKQLPKYLLPIGFFNLWSQKEAIIKCHGLGMSYPLKELTVPIFSKPGQQIIDIITHQVYQIYQFSPSCFVAGALCVAGEVDSVHFYDWQ